MIEPLKSIIKRIRQKGELPCDQFYGITVVLQYVLKKTFKNTWLRCFLGLLSLHFFLCILWHLIDSCLLPFGPTQPLPFVSPYSLHLSLLLSVDEEPVDQLEHLLVGLAQSEFQRLLFYSVMGTTSSVHFRFVAVLSTSTIKRSFHLCKCYKKNDSNECHKRQFNVKSKTKTTTHTLLSESNIIQNTLISSKYAPFLSLSFSLSLSLTFSIPCLSCLDNLVLSVYEPIILQ